MHYCDVILSQKIELLLLSLVSMVTVKAESQVVYTVLQTNYICTYNSLLVRVSMGVARVCKRHIHHSEVVGSVR